MKSIKIFALCAMGAMVLASCSGKTSDEKTPEGITKSEVNQISYMIGFNFGQWIANNNFGALDCNQIIKGIKAAIAGEEIDEETFYNTMNEYMEKRNNAIKTQNEAEAAAFFEKNGKEEGVVTTESGLQYKIVRAGNGVKPAFEDQVEVNYEGTLLDGTVFDTSYGKGEDGQNNPVTFGLGQVIAGWGEGLQFCEEGGEILLWIPAELAYGERGAGGKIGPSSALKFKVELNKVIKAEVDSTAAEAAVEAK